MNDMSNPYNRLERIFETIQNLKKADEYCVPIRDIADHSGIPLDVLRADLYCLIETAPDEYELVIDGKYAADIYESADDELSDKAAFKRNLLSGELDDAGLEVYTSDESVILPLTGEESSIMEHILREHKSGKKNRSQPFVVKDSYHFAYQDESGIYEKLYSIRAAIKEHREIRIRYRKKELTIKPVRLFYDSTDNIYAVIYLDGEGIDACRIDKTDFLGTGKVFEVPDDLNKRISIIPSVWGLDFKARPMNVRVRIFATHSKGNVGKNVKKDLKRRTKGKLYEDGDCLIYEDKVYGKEAFLRWVFGYGASMIVEKPPVLRKEIIGIIDRELNG